MNTTRSFLFSCLVFVQLPVSAATFVVNTPTDLVDAVIGDGVCLTALNNCSLRAAIQEANAFVGLDSVTLPAGTYNLTRVGTREDLSATGDLDITNNLIINGAGANQVFIDGMASDRIFQLMRGITATINGVTIRNGVADGVTLNGNSVNGGFGGGIKSEGRLTINDSNIDRNTAFVGGAGIHAVFRAFPHHGSLTVNRSNLTNNNSGGGSGGFGGHIYAENIPIQINDSVLKDSMSSSIWGMLSGGGVFYADSSPIPFASFIKNTTISNNRVMSSGGGVNVAMGALTIINSTISGNAAYEVGGGINVDAAAVLRVVNSTVAFNSAPISGGGINDFNQINTVTFVDSIVSANIGGDCATKSAGLATQGANLASDNSCNFNLANLNPQLLPLANNSGPGFTHALAVGSPALDAAVTCLTTDQRSFKRPNVACDLGAIEMSGVAPIIPVVTPLANNGVSATTNAANLAPVAFDLPAAVVAGVFCTVL